MIKNTLTLIASLALVLPAAAQVSNQGQNPATGTAPRAVRQEVREDIQKVREDFRKEIEARRESMKTTIQARREELKKKLQTIKDERKRVAVERIDQNIADLNSRATVHYASVIDQIDKVLARIISRTDTAQSNGKDVAAARAEITKSQNAISAARSAVAAQALKVYKVSVTTEANLKADVGAARQALRDDLKKAEDSVKAAREAVRQAAIALGKVQGENETKASTTTSTSQ